MRTLATAAQMKELDRIAIEEHGIPSLELMEHAATAVTQAVLGVLDDAGILPCEACVGVLCGPGNNGGDGIAAARLLLQHGCEVRAFLVGNRNKMTPDARAMEQRLIQCGGTLVPYCPDDPILTTSLSTCDVWVDGLFGVGLSRPVSGDFLHAIRFMNEHPAPVVSCDIPSGLHADTGLPLGDCVVADVTVTFTLGKPGLYLEHGREYSGRVDVAPIGIPEDVIHSVLCCQPAPLYAMSGGQFRLPRRSRTAHKGDFGKIFILAGSEGYTGAPVFAANAAVRTGAGLVFLGVPSSIYPIVAVKCNEAMPFPLPKNYDMILKKAQGCDVALIGPGLGRNKESDTLVRFLLHDLTIPVVLDADGINALSGHIDILNRRSALTVLTPHDGEFHRLTGLPLPISNRLETAREFAQSHSCVLVLKGHCTITAAPDGRVFLNDTGNPGMAKGGSGDVLAGILASLLGQKQLCGPHFDPAALMAVGVYYHGQAGDICAETLGEYSMTPSDMLAALPAVLKGHTSKS